MSDHPRGPDPRTGNGEADLSPAQPATVWRPLADRVAGNARDFIDGLTAVASGEGADETVPLLLLEMAQMMLAGAQLGASQDVILPGNWEPDVGADPDVALDALRTGLANRLAGFDEYAEIFDPFADTQATAFRLSDDLAAVAADLVHGLRHYEKPAGWPRRCGGGSTPTSATGERMAVPRCGRCTPWSRMRASTSQRSRPRASGRPPR